MSLAVNSRVTVPIYLVFHKELRRVPRVRLVLDALADALRRGLADA